MGSEWLAERSDGLAARRLSLKTVQGLTLRTYAALCDYAWPANARELENRPNAA